MLKGFETQRLIGPLTTFGIGGAAELFVEVRSVEQMGVVLSHCRLNHLPYFILGKGSNCLFPTQGLKGLVIANRIDYIKEMQSGCLEVGAGYSFSRLGVKTARAGWSGLEFACGIPGSVGGAVFMNAGANGQETSQALLNVHYLDERGRLHIYDRQQLVFSYRKSPFQEKRGAIVAATFALKACTQAAMRQKEILRYRLQTQPYGERSAGCIFRNPAGSCCSAGYLIEEMGLKSAAVGGAQVSEKHANFIVNSGNATDHDVLQLMKRIQQRAQEKQLILREEICIVAQYLRE